MSAPLALTSCRNCGAPDLGTNFCETCGAQMVRDAATAALPPASVAPAAGTDGVHGLPLALFLGGLVAAAVFSLILTLTFYTGNGLRLEVGFDVAILIADIVAVIGVWRAGVAGSARQEFRVLGFVLALLSPLLDLVAVVNDAANSNFYFYSISGVAILVLPVTTVLAWLLASGLPRRSYLSLLISAAGGLLAGFVGYGAAGVIGTVLSTAGVILAVLLAPRIGRPRVGTTGSAFVTTGGGAATSYSGPDASYAAIARPTTTNGFAVTALILGLIGGTVLPIVFGHVALTQIGRSGERGRGMAIAGLILGYLSLAVVVVIIIVVVVAAANRPAYY